MTARAACRVAAPSDAERIAALAERSLVLEIDTYPKPGLRRQSDRVHGRKAVGRLTTRTADTVAPARALAVAVRQTRAAEDLDAPPARHERAKRRPGRRAMPSAVPAGGRA
ncbi:hypothetical protein QM312_37040, partial [Burkholderia cenocepacia]|nr:hypothetical protein [Burkholderia cenocepacia]